jgi:hypothetical protein
MPTLLRRKSYRFFFYAADGWEPAHIHVVKDGKEAKIWLNDLTLAINNGVFCKGVERNHPQGTRRARCFP